MLKRFTDRVTLAFDSDTAGEKASERSIFLLRSLGFSVKVSPLPLGQDPDSMVRGGQSAQLQQLVEVDALPVSASSSSGIGAASPQVKRGLPSGAAQARGTYGIVASVAGV